MNRKQLLMDNINNEMTNFEKIDHIIDALEYLKDEAANADSGKNGDISVLIESLFNIVLVVFVNSMKVNYIQSQIKN